MSTEVIILPNSWRIEEGQNLLVKKTWIDKFDYAEVEVSNEQHFFFEANGLHLRLSVGKNGFNLWDNDNGQWILDASLVGHMANFTVGKNYVFRGVVLETSKPSVGDIQYSILPKILIDG